MSYDPNDWRRETDQDRADREHDEALERRDRAAEKGSVPSDTIRHEPDPLKPCPACAVPGNEPVLPRDVDDYPLARDKLHELALSYDSVEVDRLPPMGALHWKVTTHGENGRRVWRLDSHGHLERIEDDR